eukprot:scaffold7679_cov258-Pinguiococcus_pyrenoidosus.AAC.3
MEEVRCPDAVQQVVVRLYDERSGQAAALLRKANALFEQSEFQAAVPLYESCYRVLTSCYDSPAEGEVLFQLGLCYASLNNFSAAFNHLVGAYVVKRSTKDKSEIAVLQYIVNMLLQQGLLSRATSWLSQCVLAQQRWEDNVGAGKTMLTLAETLFKLGSFKEAFELAVQSEQVLRSMGENDAADAAASMATQTCHVLRSNAATLVAVALAASAPVTSSAAGASTAEHQDVEVEPSAAEKQK